MASDKNRDEVNDRVATIEGYTPIEGNGNTTGNVNISNINENDAIELKLSDVKSNGTIIKDLNSSYKFKY